MTRKQADAAYDTLRRHASAIKPPTVPADALGLLDRAVLSKLQRDAMIHYIAVGPDNLALAYSVLKAGAATFAAAGLAAPDAESIPAELPEPAERADPRALFATRMIAFDEALDGADPAARGTLLLDAFTGHVAHVREHLSAASPDAGVEPAGAGDALRGDLLEAAGIAYVIGQLLESPSRPAATRR